MSAPAAGSATSADDLELLARLRQGDKAAFTQLVERLHGSMLRVAMVHVGDRAVAEEVAQDAWVGVLAQLDRFEGRSSLRTWVLRIVANRARTRAVRERRTLPFSSLDGLEEPGRPAVEPERFLPAGHRWAGHWASPPRSWGDVPEERLLSAETRAEVERAVEGLPPAQRAVITLRDVEGMTAAETCQLLGLTEGNQRVLLHRARSGVRRALERYLDETEVVR
ncbi:MAG TPA: sigma-70 family RNA polymerase sigma factor [Actinomycetota bacterium]